MTHPLKIKQYRQYIHLIKLIQSDTIDDEGLTLILKQLM